MSMRSMRLSLSAGLLFLFLVPVIGPTCALVRANDTVPMLFETPGWIIVDNGIARFAIETRSGKIKSARVLGVPLEVVSQYPRYSLFFPELEFVYPNGRKDHYLPELVGDVRTEIVYTGPDAAVIEVHWDTEVIHVFWVYCFLYGRPYFIVRTLREIRKTGVYANAQQCMMAGPEFDDGHVVSYDGTWREVVVNRGPYMRIESSMFSAIDEGRSVRYPAFAWHEDELDITCGAFVTSVTPNQRETISYEQNGLIYLTPNFWEAQWNFFGKSDNETIYLEEGTRYGMEMYYYLDRGGADTFDRLNQAVFNEYAYEVLESEEYTVASWGGWRAGVEWMRWWFPQASSNYIASQERDVPRSFGIPRSQDERPSGVLDMIIKAKTETDDVNLTPISRKGPIHQDARTYVEDDLMSGEMSWEVSGFRHTLRYGVYQDSDKLIVSGEIELLEDRDLKTLYVDLWALPRVSEMVTVDAGIYDVRINDPVYDTVGLAVYDCSGFAEILNLGNAFRMLLVNHLKNHSHPRGDRWVYAFTLFPHLGYAVESLSQITPLHTRPTPTYREHYKTLPGSEGKDLLGVLPSRDVFVLQSELFSEPEVVAAVELFARQGNYPVKLFVDVPRIGAILKDGVMLPSTAWIFDKSRRMVTIRTLWEERRSSLTLFSSSQPTVVSCSESELLFEEGPKASALLYNYPNPFNLETSIMYDVTEPGAVRLFICTLTGQHIRTLVDGEYPAGSYAVTWDGEDEAGREVASGVYLCRMKTDSHLAVRKMVLAR